MATQNLVMVSRNVQVRQHVLNFLDSLDHRDVPDDEVPVVETGSIQPENRLFFQWLRDFHSFLV